MIDFPDLVTYYRIVTIEVFSQCLKLVYLYELLGHYPPITNKIVITTLIQWLLSMMMN